MKIRPLLLRDTDSMPDWIFDVLTPSQSDEARTSELFRWRKLIYASDLTAPAKAVAICLSDHCSTSRLTCNPSVSTLASETSYTRKTIESAIKILEERGFLYVWRLPYSETDQRRKKNQYGPSWPETFTMADTIARCGAEGRRGDTCQRAAGWGVKGKDSGPCRYHVEDRTTDRSTDRTSDSVPMSAGDAVHTAGDANTVRQEMPACTAGDDREGSLKVLFFEGTTPGARSTSERAEGDYFNDEDQLTDPFSDLLFEGDEEDELRDEGEDADYDVLEYDELFGVAV